MIRRRLFILSLCFFALAFWEISSKNKAKAASYRGHTLCEVESPSPGLNPIPTMGSPAGCIARYLTEAGDVYEGQFSKGKFEGLGQFTSRTGYSYLGFWQSGVPSGQGIMSFAGSVGPKMGQWDKGVLVEVGTVDRDLFASKVIEISRAIKAVERMSATLPNVPSTTNTPTEPYEQAGRSAKPLSLDVQVSGPDLDGVVLLNVSTNGDTASLRVNDIEEGGLPSGRYTIRRFVNVGETSFQIVATDRFGEKHTKAVMVTRNFDRKPLKEVRKLNPLAVDARAPRDAVMIIVGIERYRRVPSADFANRDASVFLDYGIRALGVPRGNVWLALDEQADSIEIIRAFRNWLPTRVNKGKTDVYVFYSGHGLPSDDGESLFFLPHEADRDLLERTAISQQEIVDAIQRTSPKSVTMFIDSCYSGQSRTGETLLTSARPITIVAKETSSFPPNFTVISASAPDQISSSSPELRHGIFSYYLMRGMEGEADANKDGQITVAEMQTYLSEQVPRRAMSMNRTQQPQVVGDTSRVLVGR